MSVFRILHHCAYDLARPIRACNLTARLIPPDMAGQTTLAHAVMIEPYPVKSWTRHDCFGNHVTRARLRESADRIRVTLYARVRIWKQNDKASMASIGGIPGSSARGRQNYDEPDFWRQPTGLTRANEEITEFARPILASGKPVRHALADLAGAIRNHCVWRLHASSIQTPSFIIFRNRAGICQDFAHLALACLRAHGLAARYVSGLVAPAESSHLHPSACHQTHAHETHAHQTHAHQTQAHETHAWVEVADGTDWIGLDPTQGALCGSNHIALARGRDFQDAAPLIGHIDRPIAHRLHLTTTITKISDQALRDETPDGDVTPARAGFAGLPPAMPPMPALPPAPR